MPHHDNVRTHRLYRLGGVFQALPFGHTGSGGLKRHHIRREPLRRGFKGKPSPGGVFKEKIHHRRSTQGGEFRNVSMRHGREFIRGIQ